MERIIIEDIYNVAEMMYDAALDSEQVTFVGLYIDVIELVKELLAAEEICIDYIDVEPEIISGYNREYYVYLDPDMKLGVEKAYDFEHNIYYLHETNVLLIADDCNSKILDRIDYGHAIEVGYDLDKPECDGDCENCHLAESDRHEVITRVATDDNGKLRGFEKSWETKEDGMTYHSTYQFYSSDEKMLKDMMDNFKIKYQ